MENTSWGMRKKNLTVDSIMLHILEYVTLSLFVIEGNSVYRFVTDKYYHLTLFCGLISCLLLLYLMWLQHGVRRTDVIICCMLEIWAVIYFVFKLSEVTAEIYISLFMIGLPVLFLIWRIYDSAGKPYQLFYRLSDVVCFLGAVSLVVWLLGPVLNLIPINTYISINWGREKIVGGYLGLVYNTSADTTFGFSFFRNSSIFTEAPMFNLWLNLAMAVELFLKPKPAKARILLLTLCIASTISTTGILFLVLVIGIKYWDQIKSGKNTIRFFLILLLLILAPLFCLFVYNVFLMKRDTISFMIRMKDFGAGLIVWMRHPILGSGYGNLTELMAFDYNINNKGFSNSIMAVLATGGLWMSILYIASFVGLFEKKNNVQKFSICYLYLFVSTIFFARYIAIVLLAFGLALLMKKYKLKIN